jgi:type II secretory pathway predicted ATPase ExeA
VLFETQEDRIVIRPGNQIQQRLFTDEALLQLFVQSGGIPRAIGNLALAALYSAAAQNKDLVELDEVVAAAQEVL